MCGIVGYTGAKQAAPLILEGLTKLEYRGYDSAGVAVCTPDCKMDIAKAKGKLIELYKLTNGGETLNGTAGIGHTRWATHGEPSQNNAHPHCNREKTIVAVHNGIIENYVELKEKLARRGYSFYSETDTEVATKLVDYYYKKYHNPLKAISEVALHVRGSYALGVMFSDYAGEIYAIRKNSPLVIGATDEGSILASDVPAILKYTRNVYYPENFEIALLCKTGVRFFNLDGEEIQKERVEITWDAAAAEKGGYEHFMLKEIHEQPEVVKNTLDYFVRDGKIDFSELGISEERWKKFDSVLIVGCGSAYHVGVAAQYIIEDLCALPVRVEIASEFRYRKAVLNGKELMIAISQSGETADTLAAVEEGKARGVTALAVVNVVASSIARAADHVFYTKAGPEISVATTKAYSSQLIAVYLIALKLALARHTITEEQYRDFLKELYTLPEKIETILRHKDELQKFASEKMDREDVFFIGRGIDYAVSIEGSLKLKEISYIHCEAYAAGELKHGTISLVEKGTPVFGILTQSELFEKTASNLQETKSRGAYIAALAFEGTPLNGVDKVFYIPRTDGHFAASLAVVALQLFAYYLSVLRGNDVDKPRNLAKSVTVE